MGRELARVECSVRAVSVRALPITVSDEVLYSASSTVYLASSTL